MRKNCTKGLYELTTMNKNEPDRDAPGRPPFGRVRWAVVALSWLVACSAMEAIDVKEPPVVECAVADDCAGPVGHCRYRNCDEGRCVIVEVPEGFALPSQQEGDCHLRSCGPNFEVVDIFDAKDVPSPTQSCVVLSCDSQSQTVEDEPASAGTPCTESSPGESPLRCDGDGTCVECLDATDCDGCDPNGDSCLCVDNACVPEQCTNGMPDVGETAVDCGGSDCGSCADGLACVIGADCNSGVCTALICAAPACDDNVKNGTETDDDCGGPGQCDRCGVGQICVAASDCESVVCLAPENNPVGACQAPTCKDGVSNGGESDIDCGGADCEGCKDGEKCNQSADCTGVLSCKNGVCDLIEAPGNNMPSP